MDCRGWGWKPGWFFLGIPWSSEGLRVGNLLLLETFT